jgi:hypothetical protein
MILNIVWAYGFILRRSNAREIEEGVMDDERNLGPSRLTATRRHVIGSLAMTLGAFALRPGAALAATEEEISHSQESIHHVTVFKASRERIYQALTNTKQFDQITKLSPEMRAGMSLGK